MNSDFYYSETKLVDQLCNRGSSNLLLLFKQRTKRWRHPIMHCEGYTLGIFDDLAQKISNDRAFELIPKSLDISLVQENNNLLLASLSLASLLIQASNTTEITPTISSKLTQLKDKIKMLPHSKETETYFIKMCEFYRRAF